MMRGLSQVRFLWRTGRRPSEAAAALLGFFQERGFCFKGSPRPTGSGPGPFVVYARWADGPADFSFKDVAPPTLDSAWPASETRNFALLVRKAEDDRWVDFYAHREMNAEYQPTGNASLVYLIQMFFDGCLWAERGESAEEFQNLLRKYDQVKQLWKLLECDEVVAWDEHYSPTPGFVRRWPFQRDKLLRLANEGTQVLVRRMEERRQSVAYQWPEARIFLDPPGSVHPSPEEYARRWQERKED